MKLFDYHTPIQLNLFGPTVLKTLHLKAETSKHRAFYSIWLIEENGHFSVKKESGAKGKIYHRKIWDFRQEKDAHMFYESKIREKTNPNRKLRVYA